MPSSLRVRLLTTPFLTIHALCLIPLPASSCPVIVSNDAANDGTLTLSPSCMDGPGEPSNPRSLTRTQPYANAASGLSLALPITCLWITNKIVAIRFANSDVCGSSSPHLLCNSCPDALLCPALLAAPITVAEQLAQQLSYLRFTTLLRIATANTLDADDAGLDPARPRVQDGLSRPVSSAPQSLEPIGHAVRSFRIMDVALKERRLTRFGVDSPPT